jgi:hypothetical protein
LQGIGGENFVVMGTSEFVSTSAKEAPIGKIRGTRNPSPVNIDEIDHTVERVSCSLPVNPERVKCLEFD